jgi:hypothetical protein
MFTGHIEPTPHSPLPYRVVVRRLGEIVRMRPVMSIADGNRALLEMLREEQENEKAIRGPIDLDA